MKATYNRYERIAGVFVVIALIGIGINIVGVVIKKGWLASKQTHYTYLQTASGIHSGTDVQMSGINVGWVDYVELIQAGKVKVTFYILEKFAGNIREDSRIQIVRPYLIGEKVLELSVGSTELNPIVDGEEIENISGIDMVDLLSGRLLGPLMSNIENLVSDMHKIVATLDDADVDRTIAAAIEYMEPLMKNMNSMSREMTIAMETANQNQRLKKTFDGVLSSTQEMNKFLPVIAKVTPDVLAGMNDLSKLTENMLKLTEDIKTIMPTIQKMSEGAPEATAKAIQVMDESILTMQALQKTFLLRGKVKEVIKESGDK